MMVLCVLCHHTPDTCMMCVFVLYLPREYLHVLRVHDVHDDVGV